MREAYSLHIPGKPKACECFCKYCRKGVPCLCGRLRKCECGAPIQVRDGIWYSSKYHVREGHFVGDPCAHIEWSSYITAYGRCELTAAQLELPRGSLLYSDTDSIFSLHPLTRRIGNAADPYLGEWIAKEIAEFQALAPKVYAYVDPEKGKLEVASKGVRIPKGERPQAGKVYESGSSVYGLKKGVKEGVFFRRNQISRKLSLRSGDRILMPDGMTRAPHISELDMFGV